MTASLYDAGPTSCVILIGGERAELIKLALEIAQGTQALAGGFAVFIGLLQQA